MIKAGPKLVKQAIKRTERHIVRAKSDRILAQVLNHGIPEYIKNERERLAHLESLVV